MLRLTKTFIDKIEPPPPRDSGKPAQAFYRDTALAGFGLYVMTSGTKTFFVEKRIHGRVKRINIGRYGELTPDQARKAATKLLGEIAIGQDPAKDLKARRAKSVTLGEAFSDYLIARKDLKPSTIHDYRRGIESALADWCDRPLKDLSKDMIEKRHSQLGEKSPARANNTMRVLRAVFNFAMDKYEDADGDSVFPVNPVNRISKSRGWYRVERRQTLLKPHELKPWYDAVMLLNVETTRDYLLFLLFTGLRRSEAAQLSWSDVDFKDKSIRIDDTKNREPHVLPMSDFLFDLLTERKANNHKQSPWVFPSDMTDSHLVEPRTAVDRVCERIGVRFRLHDLRRTFITIAESLDIPGYALKNLLNHRQTNDVTAGYIVMHVDRLRGPMEEIAQFMLRHIDSDKHL